MTLTVALVGKMLYVFILSFMLMKYHTASMINAKKETPESMNTFASIIAGFISALILIF